MSTRANRTVGHDTLLLLPLTSARGNATPLCVPTWGPWPLIRREREVGLPRGTCGTHYRIYMHAVGGYSMGLNNAGHTYHAVTQSSTSMSSVGPSARRQIGLAASQNKRAVIDTVQADIALKWFA